MIVIDASALLAVLLNTPAAARVAERLFGPGETLHAPHLLDLEVAQVLRRYALAGDLDELRAFEALSDHAALPLNRYPHDFLLPRIWELRRNATAYDASYIALAEVLHVPLVTCDRGLGTIPSISATVEVIS